MIEYEFIYFIAIDKVAFNIGLKVILKTHFNDAFCMFLLTVISASEML